MSKVVHVMPVGVNKERLLESIRKSGYPIQKVYLVLGRDVDLDWEAVKNSAAEIERTLNVLVEVEKIDIEKMSVYAAALDMLKTIKREIDEGSDVLINTTDASRTFCLASYVAAQLSGSKLYMAIPKIEDGKEVGIERIEEIAIPPVKKTSDDKILIIKTIQEQGGEVESINKLIELLEGKTDDQKRYMAQRARMSYHLKGLEEDGLVEMKREGKNVKIRLTELGQAFALMAS
ncbi:MAG: hypothetical protein DSY33_00250 [Archaeoglobus sp.]|jgi:DNA-binding transcriptional ArsR family regulator|nr:MAG: hypothetical protein DSY33_00250 [Archaeoglobus sp.]